MIPVAEVSEMQAIDVLWGAEEIAKAIKRTPRQVNHMLSTRALPAKKVAGRWCASRAELAKFFGTAPSGEPAA